MNSSDSALVWAQRFAAEGHPVLPLHSVEAGRCSCASPKCSSPGKQPCTQDGLTGASTDVKQLERWNRAYPDANWGVRCDQLVVFDADDVDSADALLHLTQTRGEAPGLVVATGRGMHLYYRSRGDRAFRHWAGKVPGLQVDLRTGLSYVVGPGSTHVSGATYEPRGNIRELAPVPDWAVPLAAGELVKGGRAGLNRSLRAELELAPPPGSRHDWMARVCGYLATLLREYRELYDAAIASAVTRLPDVEGFPAVEWQQLRDDIWEREVTSPDSAKTPRAGGGHSVATSLVEIADDLFETVLLDTGIAAVVPTFGPNVAAPLNEKGPRSARARLAAEYFRRTGRAASQNALAEAIETLSGRAGAQEPVTAWMRVAPYGDGVVIDLGDAEGCAIIVGPTGWRLVARSPVLMFRTSANMPLPSPSTDSPGGLDSIRHLFNLTDEQFDLLVGWLVGALLLPEAPVPVLVLSGPGGVAKSTTTEFAVQLIDPSAVPRRAIAHQRDFHVVTAATRVVPVENLSSVPKWLSDRVSAAVTGEGLLLRTLYETTGITVVSYRRVFTFNGVGIGEAITSADLADRVMVIEPQPIREEKRLTERELRRAFADAHPAALGALLDLASRTLAQLPSVQLDRPPRMADFARVLLAGDSVRGTSTLKFYLAARASMGDALLAEGTFGGELLALLERDARPSQYDRTWTLETNASELRRHMFDRLGGSDTPEINQIRHGIDLVRPQLAKEGWYFNVSKSGSRRRYRFSKQIPPGATGAAGTVEPQRLAREGDEKQTPSIASLPRGIPETPDATATEPACSPGLARMLTNWQRDRDRQTPGLR